MKVWHRDVGRIYIIAIAVSVIIVESHHVRMQPVEGVRNVTESFEKCAVSLVSVEDV